MSCPSLCHPSESQCQQTGCGMLAPWSKSQLRIPGLSSGYSHGTKSELGRGGTERSLMGATRFGENTCYYVRKMLKVRVSDRRVTPQFRP